jgi:hypothetical protein
MTLTYVKLKTKKSKKLGGQPPPLPPSPNTPHTQQIRLAMTSTYVKLRTKKSPQKIGGHPPPSPQHPHTQQIRLAMISTYVNLKLNKINFVEGWEVGTPTTPAPKQPVFVSLMLTYFVLYFLIQLAHFTYNFIQFLPEYYAIIKIGKHQFLKLPPFTRPLNFFTKCGVLCSQC